MDDTKKRERSANFTYNEVQLLVSLVDRYKSVIENKKTDAVTNKEKDDAWKKIEIAFNSCGVSPNSRKWKTLKLKYEGIKKATKKKSSVQRQEMYRTGGGPSNAPQFNDVEEKVLGICSNITGLEARHDSDIILVPPSDEVPPLQVIELLDSMPLNSEMQDNEQHETTGQAYIEIPDMDNVKISMDDVGEPVNKLQKEAEADGKENNWERWHPKALKTRISDVLKINPAVTKASVTAKLDKLSTARLELVHLQTENARKQHELLVQEHNLKMLHLAKDEERKQEIHQVVMQKLQAVPISTDFINKF